MEPATYIETAISYHVDPAIIAAAAALLGETCTDDLALALITVGTNAGALDDVAAMVDAYRAAVA